MPLSNLIQENNEYPAEMFQVMNEHGEIVNPEAKALVSDEQVIDFYKWMRKIRIMDTRANNLQRTGKMGTYPSIYGQEACQIGAGLALEKKDWLVPTFRESGMMWAYGVPPENVYLYWRGNEEGSKHPEDCNCLPIAITVGGHTIHATGIGWANKLQKKDSVVLCSFSDGATSEGDFHAALNYAGVLKTPNVFFCQQNHYAISTYSAIQTASKTFAQKAFAYGLRGVYVDGNDVIATYLACKESIESVRKGEIGVFIEALTYRLGNHTSADNAKLYREDSEVEAWQPKEPLIRVRKYLDAQGLWSNEKEDAWVSECEKDIDIIVENVLKYEKLKAENMFTMLYKDIPPILEEQLESFKKEVA